MSQHETSNTPTAEELEALADGNDGMLLDSGFVAKLNNLARQLRKSQEPIFQASQAQQKCSCVYATARNTPAVKAGYEMGGYVKTVCAYCQSQAQQETVTVQQAWEWAGGNPETKATRQDLEEALKLLDEICEEADKPSQAQQPTKMQFLDRSKEKIITLLWQGICDGTVEAFDVNGMMVIPSDLGVTYVRKEDVISFFGLVEPSQAQQPTDLNSFIQKHVHVDGNDAWTYNSLASSAQDFIDSAVEAFESQAQQPTDLSEQLREYAGNSGYSHNDYADTMLAAASEIERLTVSQAQQESNLHWCGTCEQNVERGCGDSACQYRYKLPPAPEGTLTTNNEGN